MLSIVRFVVYQDIPVEERIFDPPFPDESLTKDGVVLCVDGIVGDLADEFAEEGYSLFRNLFEDVDISGFWDNTNRNAIGQYVVSVFDVRWERDYEGYEYDRTIGYLGICDADKWTTEGLKVISS